MPVPKGIRMAGQALPIINKLVDIGTTVYELDNPIEPSLRQRLLNALIIGGGNAVVGRTGGGFDVIPSLLGGAKVESPLQHVNPDAQFRRLSYRLGQGAEIGLHEREQLEAIQKLAAGKKREPTYTPQQLEQMYGRGLGGMF
jgi:hypothetical protein